MSKKLYLYHLTQGSVNGYDTYSDCVVCAESFNAAKKICPDSYYKYIPNVGKFCWSTDNSGTKEDQYIDSWPKSPDDVTATRIGIAANDIKKGQVICASFHAG